MAKTTVASLEQVVLAQAEVIADLKARVAALEEQPTSAATPAKRTLHIDAIAELPVLGRPGERVACSIEGHGVKSLNKNGHCPACACQAVKVAFAAKNAARQQTPVSVA